MNHFDRPNCEEERTPIDELICIARAQERTARNDKDAEAWAVAATVIENAIDPWRFLLSRAFWFLLGMLFALFVWR